MKIRSEERHISSAYFLLLDNDRLKSVAICLKEPFLRGATLKELNWTLKKSIDRVIASNLQVLWHDHVKVK